MKKFLHLLTLLLPLGLMGQPQLLTDMSPGTVNTSVKATYEVNGKTLLETNTGLWVTDGSPAGTHQLSTSMSSGRVEDQYLFFVADGFWRTDGTVAGTEQLYHFTQANGQYSLWKNDPGGDVLVKTIPKKTCTETYTDTVYYHDLSPHLRYYSLYWQGNWWFELRHEAPSGLCDEYDADDTEIWVTNGTGMGTKVVHDLGPEYSEGLGFLITNGNLLWYEFGTSLWVFDGSETAPLFSQSVGWGTSFEFEQAILLQGNAYFVTSAIGRGYDCYAKKLIGSDGDSAWSVFSRFSRISDINLHVYQDKLLIEVDYEVSGYCGEKYSLFVSDGTTGGTQSLGDYIKVIALSDPLLLQKNHDQNIDPQLSEGRELWISDGTPSGTTILKDIQPGSGSGLSLLAWGGPQFIKWGNKTFFTANDGTHGRELWSTDLTNAGTVMVKDIRTGSDSSVVSDPFVATSSQGVFFVADDGTHGRELWITDGTPGGTMMVKELTLGSGDAGILQGYSLDDKVIFEVKISDTDRELWVSDGSPAGTRMIKSFVSFSPDYYNNRTSGFANFGDWLVLNLKDGASSQESSLWATNGTPAGTILLAGDDEWNGRNNPTDIVNHHLLFMGKDLNHGEEPWTLDINQVFQGDFTLIDAQADTLIGPIENGATLDLTFLPTDRLNIMVNNVPLEVDKVWFDIDRGVIAHHDNNPPFCMARDDQAGNYYYHTFTPGPYTLTADLKDGNAIVETRVLNFTVIRSPETVTGFSLVNARDNIVLGPLNHDDVIDLASIGTNKLNIIVHTAPEDIGSVAFALSGSGTFNQYDNQPPYCMAQDNQNGGYYQYLFSPGTYTLTATPYTQYAAGGDAGTPMTIGFTVVNSGARMAVPAEAFSVYPNPTTGKLNLQFVNVAGGKASLQVFDMQGRLIQFQTLAVQPGTSELSVRVYDLPAGMYTMTCRFGRERYTTQFIKQ